MSIKCNFINSLCYVLFVSLLSIFQSDALLFAQESLSGIEHPAFVGSHACIACHQLQGQQWKGSHHDLAIQEATEESVLGDFSNVSFTYHGIVTRFYRDGDKFMVNTDGPDGGMYDYEISYTFGVSPLQQYLIEFPDGRVQALSIAWDARSKSDGGQRWYHLYPDDHVQAGDDLHWTGDNQNWNFMCASCHSTQVRKNYDLSSNTYDTKWSEINVGCEACHGNGEHHLLWANRSPGWEAYDNAEYGLTITYQDRPQTIWAIDSKTGSARGVPRVPSEREIDVCAPCHSLRSQLSEDEETGTHVGEAYRVSLLDRHLYYPDGSIKEEVYVYGSFLQSKMYHQGVSCRDCHEPHSLQLHEPNEGICLRCHVSEKYHTPEHHFHSLDEIGSSCVECHMPPRNYMVIDARHDHSFRIPRPDLSVRFGTPNACNQCHVSEDPQWALNKVVEWYGDKPSGGFQNYTEAFHSADNGVNGAGSQLLSVVKDTTTPAIARASAINRLTTDDLPGLLKDIQLLSSDESSLVRRTLVERLSELPLKGDLPELAPLLSDSVREVREATALFYMTNTAVNLNERYTTDLLHALLELESSHNLDADKPETHLRLARLRVLQNRIKAAEDELKIALKIDPNYIPAVVNLVDLYKTVNREGESEALLRGAINSNPDNAALYHALGLWYVRQDRLKEALTALDKSAKLSPDNHRFALVYAMALHSVEEGNKAIAHLEQHSVQNGYDRDILLTLARLHLDQNNNMQAMEYANQVLQENPDDREAERLIHVITTQKETVE